MFTFQTVVQTDETLLALMQALYAEDGFAVFDEALARRGLETLLASAEFGRVFYVCRSREIIGYVVLCFGFSLEFGGRDAFVDELYIAPRFRSLGAGTAAIAYATQICHNEGIQALHLEVERHNTRAQNLYRRLGFVDHDRYLLTRRLSSDG